MIMEHDLQLQKVMNVLLNHLGKLWETILLKDSI